MRTVATNGKGIDELAKACERHRERGLETRETESAAINGATGTRRRRRAHAAVREHVLDRLRRAVDEALADAGPLVDRVATRAVDPYTAADELVRAITGTRASE